MRLQIANSTQPIIPVPLFDTCTIVGAQPSVAPAVPIAILQTKEVSKTTKKHLLA